MPLEIVGSPQALARLQEIGACAGLDKPDAAEGLAERIVSLTEALRIHPLLGCAGAEPGIRELLIGGAPYVVLYRVQGKRVIIRTIWHGAHRKEP